MWNHDFCTSMAPYFYHAFRATFWIVHMEVKILQQLEKRIWRRRFPILFSKKCKNSHWIMNGICYFNFQVPGFVWCAIHLSPRARYPIIHKDFVVFHQKKSSTFVVQRMVGNCINSVVSHFLLLEKSILIIDLFGWKDQPRLVDYFATVATLFCLELSAQILVVGRDNKVLFSFQKIFYSIHHIEYSDICMEY